MNTLSLGVVLFVGVHLVPAIPPIKRALVKRVGFNAYRGLFSLVALAGLLAMIFGKASAGFVHVYAPPSWGRHLALTVMPFASILLTAAYLPGHLRRWVRHPMLLGVAAWATCHLFANGDQASLLLFGGMLAFALLDLGSHLFREAAAPRPAHAWADAVAVLVGGGSYVATLYLHGMLFGPPIW